MQLDCLPCKYHIINDNAIQESSSWTKSTVHKLFRGGNLGPVRVTEQLPVLFERCDCLERQLRSAWQSLARCQRYLQGS